MLWLILFSVLLLVATWLVVLLVHLPLWIAIVVTALLVVAVATVFIVRMIRAQMRAAALERELLRQAAAQAERVRPDKRPEILALQAQMKAALDTLKRSKLGKGGKSALYSLPWYAIVGPPAAGKTTALSQSGLGFITPAGAGGAKVRGTAGTKNCDWWFSQHAILLDTAGRLSTEEDDHEEWATFLDTLRRFRPERPLDGVVMALSVEDLLGATEDQNEELVRKLRQRVDELMSKTEMVLPVYVMFTKVDLIAGFVEFFGDLGKQQRGQAWGASFSIDDERLDDAARATESEFEGLMRVLHSHMLERLSREPQPEVRQRVMQFPLEFQALAAPVARFVEELARQNPYQETPLVRGFYFSSGTQTGRAMDRVLANMARGFDLRGFGAAEARPTQAQSYFVTDLFAKVIFPDRHLAVRSMSRIKRRNRQRAIWAAVAVLITLLIVAPATSSYVDNSELMQAAERDVQQARTLERSGEASSAANALNLLLDRTEQLEREQTKTSVRGFFGPYTAKDLASSFGGVYVERLRAMVEGDVKTQLTSDVRSIGDLMRTDIRNFQSAYEDLKLYVMLTQPQRLQAEFATRRLSQVWARALHSTAESDQKRLESHAARYVAGLAADPSWAWKPDTTALVRAQGKLSMLPIDELRFSWLNEAAQGAPPIRPEKIFFGASAQYWKTRGNVEVPGLYTKLGWDKVRPLLESPDARLELEPWVLGHESAVEVDTKENAAERLRDLLFPALHRGLVGLLRGARRRRADGHAGRADGAARAVGGRRPLRAPVPHVEREHAARHHARHAARQVGEEGRRRRGPSGCQAHRRRRRRAGTAHFRRWSGIFSRCFASPSATPSAAGQTARPRGSRNI
ncbi:MAG: type VI secretion system membrane subunit TssM [Polyangiaceae bacterium]